MSRTDHNWNQIHKGLLALGFQQVITHNDKLYYKKDEFEAMLFRSNHVDTDVVKAMCEHINVSYDYFVDMYKQSYATSVR